MMKDKKDQMSKPGAHVPLNPSEVKKGMEAYKRCVNRDYNDFFKNGKRYSGEELHKRMRHLEALLCSAPTDPFT